MTQPTVHRFNPFDLRHGTNQFCHEWVQEVIYYGESRLRKAIIAMSRADAGKQEYFHQFLWRELHFFMQYVGIGASVCMDIDIPITLRSLANSFTHLTKNTVPVLFDLDFLGLLESGTRPTDPFLVVESYRQAWWKGHALEKRMGPINEDTITDAIVYHRTQLNIHASTLLEEDPTHMVLPSANPDNYTRALFEAVCTAKSLTSGLYITAQAEREHIFRRASVFHMLHHAGLPVHDNESQKSVEHHRGSNVRWVRGNDNHIPDKTTVPRFDLTEDTAPSSSSNNFDRPTSDDHPEINPIPVIRPARPRASDFLNVLGKTQRPALSDTSKHMGNPPSIRARPKASDFASSVNEAAVVAPNPVIRSTRPSASNLGKAQVPDISDMSTKSDLGPRRVRPRASDFANLVNEEPVDPRPAHPRMSNFIGETRTPDLSNTSAKAKPPSSRTRPQASDFANIPKPVNLGVVPNPAVRPTRPRAIDFANALQPRVSDGRDQPANISDPPTRPRVSDFAAPTQNLIPEMILTTNIDDVPPNIPVGNALVHRPRLRLADFAALTGSTRVVVPTTQQHKSLTTTPATTALTGNNNIPEDEDDLYVDDSESSNGNNEDSSHSAGLSEDEVQEEILINEEDIFSSDESDESK